MKLVVMIPAYNEERTIGKVIDEIPREMPGIKDIEILIINDGSTDETRNVASKFNRTSIISHKSNCGLATAFRTGIKYSLERGADIIVNIDADYQHDPKYISQLIEPIISERADVVLGSRFKGYIEDMPVRKKIGNRVATYVTGILSGFRTSDAQSGFRAYSRIAAENLKIFGKKTYVQETIIRPARLGFRLTEIPITFKKRDGKSKLIKSIWGYAISVFPYMVYSFFDALRCRTHVRIR